MCPCGRKSHDTHVQGWRLWRGTLPTGCWAGRRDDVMGGGGLKVDTRLPERKLDF